MNKNVWIDLDAVNSSISVLDTELMHLNDQYERAAVVTSELPDAWSGQKTEKIYSEIELFKNSIQKIHDSINNIKNNVSQYKTNVQNVDSYANLDTKSN